MVTVIDIDEMPETKRKLVDAGIDLMRIQGYNATTVDDICAAAGVTKGGFFHYFKSKEDIAKAAVARFGYDKDQDLHDAPFRKLEDPLARVYGRLDFSAETFAGPKPPSKGCLIGSFAQELSFTHPELRDLCHGLFQRIAHDFAADLTSARALYAPNASFDPQKLALFYVSLFQGSHLLAKTSADKTVIRDNIEQFRSFLQMLFGQIQPTRN